MNQRQCPSLPSNPLRPTTKRRRRYGPCPRRGTWLLSMLLLANATVRQSSSSSMASATSVVVGTPHKKAEEQDPDVTSELFEPCDEIRVVGPTTFPKPTAPLGPDASVVVKPTYGSHISHHDAILAYAEGYSLPYYIMFLETLEQTGYTGDVVLAVAETRLMDKSAETYLVQYASRAGHNGTKPNLVLYQVPLDCDNPDGSRSRAKDPRGEQLDVFQMCRLSHVYGVPNAATTKGSESFNMVPQPDPREGRVVATLRYEWYWIWSLHYQSTSWIMLLDARDSFFQRNPFASVPRQHHHHHQPKQHRESPAASDGPSGGGLLYLFGENHVATRLGKSTKNLKWLKGAYGKRVLNALKDKPTICSGSTMGEQVAIETYLRAMVNEHDECDIRMTGSDQGFHNYLYYSGKLASATNTIRRIVVWEQGKGIINNLGALRIKKLAEWGAYNVTENQVLQWDGTVSPVAHQFDRDHDLFHAMMDQHRQWTKAWAGVQLSQV